MNNEKCTMIAKPSKGDDLKARTYTFALNLQ